MLVLYYEESCLFMFLIFLCLGTDGRFDCLSLSLQIFHMLVHVSLICNRYDYMNGIKWSKEVNEICINSITNICPSHTRLTTQTERIVAYGQSHEAVSQPPEL